MIDITKLTDKDIGRWVIYKPFHAKSFDDRDQWERGKLKSWNDTNIFVVYHCNNEWHRFQDYTGAATDPNDLIFEEATNA